MTRVEAIKILEMFLHKQCDLERTNFAYTQSEVWNAVKMASEALEKQIPKKPIQGTKYKWIDTVRERGRYSNNEKYSYRKACPICKKNVLQTNYCECCGQALDWNEEND